MYYIWIAIIILLAIVEVMTVNLTTIWFVASGLIALALSFVTDNFLLQVGVFSLLGIVLLITTRPILTKWLHGKKEKTNLDRIIGMKGIVTEAISKNKMGEVKVDGKRWTAYAVQELPIDEVVKILEITGVKVKVEKWEEK